MNINEENTNELYETLNASVDLRNMFATKQLKLKSTIPGKLFILLQTAINKLS